MATSPNYAITYRQSGMDDLLKQVKQLQPRTQSVYNPEFKPGSQVNLNQLYGAVGSKPTRTFGMEQLSPYMQAQQQAGSRELPQFQQQYQTPEGLANLVMQMQQALAPLTASQQQSAQTAYNQSMMDLQNKWARQGLLASGGAMAQARQGAGELSRTMADIEAQNLATAIPLALQSGQLGLDEANLLFQQALSSNQYEQQVAQQSFTNMLAAIGMNEDQIQNYISNLTNVTGLDMTQNQWAQEFGLSQQQNDFNRWLATQELNQRSSSDWLNQLLQAGGLAEQSRQFDTASGMDMDRFLMDLREKERQFNFGNALDWSKLFGEYVTPVQSGTGLQGQLAGKQTIDSQMGQLDALLKMATLTPEIAQGLGGALGGSNLFSDIGGLLNQMGGRMTTPAWQTLQEIALRREEMASRERISSMSAGTEKDLAEDKFRFQAWAERGGPAPYDIPSLGIKTGDMYTPQIGIDADISELREQYGTDDGTAGVIYELLFDPQTKVGSREAAISQLDNVVIPAAKSQGKSIKRDTVIKAINDSYEKTSTSRFTPFWSSGTGTSYTPDPLGIPSAEPSAGGAYDYSGYNPMTEYENLLRLLGLLGR